MPKPTETSKFGNTQSPYTSSTIPWTGPEIPCIGLCKGDMVSGVVYKIGTRLCELYEDYEDLKNLDFSCVIEKLNINNPSDYSLKTLFQILLDNDCQLKDLIDSITNNSTGNVLDFSTLNLGCLEEVFTDCNDCNPENLISILQKIIDEICAQKIRLDGIDVSILDIITRLEIVEGRTAPTNPISEAEINSCLNPVPALPLPISTHISTITDPEICDIRSLIGSNTDIAGAFTKACPTKYEGLSGVVVNPTTIADGLSSLYAMACYDYDLITDCCQPTCDKIKLGFGVTYNGTSITVNFLPSYGTSIPAAFADCGSLITITDINNAIATSPISLSNNASATINISGLDVSQKLTVSVKTCLETPDIKCTDCISQEVGPFVQGSECTLCRFCVTGPDGSYIILDHTVNGIQKSVTLNEGTCITFKTPEETVVINSIISVDNAVLSRDQTYFCDNSIINLPNPVGETCWFFELPRVAVNNATPSIDIKINHSYLSLETTAGTIPLSGGINVINDYPINPPSGLTSLATLVTQCEPPGQTTFEEIGIILSITGQSTANPPLLVINQKQYNGGTTIRDLELIIRGKLRPSCQCN